MLRLQKKSLNWALKHALECGDTDVFPKGFEFDAIKFRWEIIRNYLLAQDLDCWITRPPRSVLSPKSIYGFRIITQLDPLDFLIFSSLMYEIGKDLEASRIPIEEQRVYSYRFSPSRNGKMYRDDVGYSEFEKRCEKILASRKFNYVVVTDIADFYPRIYSHRLDNALQACTKKADHVRVILKLLSGWNETETHGIPVGSAPARLLAEITINDVDNALAYHGIEFVRFVDDYRIFAKTYKEAFKALSLLAQTLYDNHGLTLQPQKTTIVEVKKYHPRYSPEELHRLKSEFSDFLEDLGISDPYEPIEYDSLSESQQKAVDLLNLREMFCDEIEKQTEPDIGILRFILRRMGQLGDPSLVDIILLNWTKIHPVFADVVHYFKNLRHLDAKQRETYGRRILKAHEESVFSELPFYCMWIFSLFSESQDWNNLKAFPKLLEEAKDLSSRRELILAMGRAQHTHWFQSHWRRLFDEPHWSRRAVLAAASCMAPDARKHWYKSILPKLDVLERAVVDWAKENPFNDS
jgi:hypothetical protein